MDNSKIDNLNKELKYNFKKAKTGKLFINILKFPMYLGALGFLLFIAFNAFFINKNPEFYQAGGMQKYILIIFGVFVVSQMFFMPCLLKFNKLEEDTIRNIIRSLFPNSSYYNATQSEINEGVIKSSKLFPKFGVSNNLMHCATYGMLKIKSNNADLQIYDVGVSFGTTKTLMASNGITGYFLMIYSALIKPLFSQHVENALFNFRGMFCYSEMEKNIGANVLIFPDYLEDKLGYLANNIQAMKTVYKNKLVKLEDPDFERAFEVYSDDEVAARRVLTPLMMKKMLTLRNKFGRDVMFSFCNNGFYFATNMPEGLFSLDVSGSKKDSNIVAEMYDDISTAETIIKELKLKQKK